MKKAKLFSLLVAEIAKFTGIPATKEEAIKAGADSYLYLEHDSIYGWALWRINIYNGGFHNPFDGWSGAVSYPTAKFEIALRGVLIGLKIQINKK